MNTYIHKTQTFIRTMSLLSLCILYICVHYNHFAPTLHSVYNNHFSLILYSMYIYRYMYYNNIDIRYRVSEILQSFLFHFVYIYILESVLFSHSVQCVYCKYFSHSVQCIYIYSNHFSHSVKCVYNLQSVRSHFVSCLYIYNNQCCLTYFSHSLCIVYITLSFPLAFCVYIYITIISLFNCISELRVQESFLVFRYVSGCFQ